MADKIVLLRMKGSKESQPFEAGHAQRLLDYPNPQWEEVAEKEPAAKAPATTTSKSGKASDVPLPPVDATSQPTSV